MPTLSKQQIEKLMEKATKHIGKTIEIDSPVWIEHVQAVEAIHSKSIDIAQTALDALQKVEELEKELKDSKDIAQVWCDRSYALGYDPSKTP